ncbi:MAG: hypothetical protein ACTSO9_14440 [Candidatus Helarchaeota archaeon]
MSEEKTNEAEDNEVEAKRVQEEREKLKEMGLEDKSKDAFSILTNVDKEKEESHHKKLRDKKFVGF